MHTDLIIIPPKHVKFGLPDLLFLKFGLADLSYLAEPTRQCQYNPWINHTKRVFSAKRECTNIIYALGYKAVLSTEEFQNLLRSIS